MQTLDDRHPDIKYLNPKGELGSWFYGGARGEYRGTTTGTFTQSASMRFDFNGTYIGVYGTVSNDTRVQPPVCIFTLDDEITSTWNPTLQPFIQMNQLMFEAKFLDPNRRHTMRMNATTAGAYTWVDYINILPTPPKLPKSQKTPLPNLAVAGITLGGCLVTQLVVILLWLWLRKFRATRKKRKLRTVSLSSEMVRVSPYDSIPRANRRAEYTAVHPLDWELRDATFEFPTPHHVTIPSSTRPSDLCDLHNKRSLVLSMPNENANVQRRPSVFVSTSPLDPPPSYRVPSQ
ncbi:hypothetical protein L218DRAFT_951732 [Marasmius fiardii PR-910]|nr:hypothetical protein L218DRAFT_951732 [Marasmius fiardii PR-910]